MTPTHRAGGRIEWNPTGDEWLPGTVVETRGVGVVIRLDGGDVLMVDGKHLRTMNVAREPEGGVMETAP